MNYLQIIMILGALFGFIYVLRVKETYARIINWAMVVAVGITFARIAQLQLDGYYLFAITQLAVIVYGVSGDFGTSKKITLSACGVLSLIPTALFLSGMMLYYPIIGALAGIIHLIIFASALKTAIQSYKEEMGFLIILAADALVRVIGGILMLAVVFF